MWLERLYPLHSTPALTCSHLPASAQAMPSDQNAVSILHVANATGASRPQLKNQPSVTFLTSQNKITTQLPNYIAPFIFVLPSTHH